MRRTRIKICGVTRPEDAALAAEAGADAIGMVFHPPQRRCVSVDMAQRIVAALSPMVTPVALFVDQSLEQINEVCCALRVRTVQLNGREPPEFIARLDGFSVIRSLPVEAATFRADLDRWRADIERLTLKNLAGFVLETAGTGKPGGSGVENDWATVASARAAGAMRGLPRIIAAGGLRPENVGSVVRTLRPWAVDVSSGVESAVGRKSPELVGRFVAAVRQADAG